MIVGVNLRSVVGLLVVVVVIVVGMGMFLIGGSRNVDSSRTVETRETANGDPYRLVSLERPTEIGTLTQTLEIGVEDGPESYLFGLIADIAVGSDGIVAVLDSQVPIVRLYDPSGVFLRNIGREGDGPGEYRNPVSVLLAEGGRVLVCQNRGINTYSNEGELEHSVRLGFGYCILTGKEDGGAIVSVGTYRRPYTLWLSSGGEVADSFATPEPRIVVDSNLTRSAMVYIYSPSLLSDWSPDGTRVAVWTEDVAVEVDHAPRETRAVDDALTLITMDVDRIPLPTDEREQLMEPIRTIRGRSGSGLAPAEEIVATHKPAIQSLLVGEDGRVWLRGSTPSIEVEDHDRAYREGAEMMVEGWGERGIFYMFSLDGPSVRAFRPSFPITPMFAWGDTVWAAYESEAGAPKVGRFTVTW